MLGNNDPEASDNDDCTLPPPPMPAEKLGRYNLERDPDSEQDIARYVELEAPGEQVDTIERVKSEFVVGVEHVI